jgi:hypothetical protein
MKKRLSILFLILLININLKAQQRYIIIDRKLKTPARNADTITKEQMDKGFFAVEKQNIDLLIVKLDSLSKRLRNVIREKYDENKLVIGTTVLSIRVVKQSFADRLNIALSTDTGHGYDHSIYIVDAKLTNNDNARYLNRLIKYIDKEKF